MFLDALGNADRSAHSRWVALDPTKNLRLETTHAGRCVVHNTEMSHVETNVSKKMSVRAHLWSV
jgi:hypothetical protein